jgi:hypothetical protein
MYLPDKQKVAGPFTLRLVNPDGQAAEYELIVDTGEASEPSPSANWMPLGLTDPERILQWENDLPEWIPCIGGELPNARLKRRDLILQCL